ncbi:bifunctional DNA-formamidopyrimidine glycosylase/DNA-(apurinic or apyrimidinic site) lyase [Massilia sp. W12]|uniref:bifunctional DNA-formamidopyrimidine glycosylase/DNA-(apurinic or apyrimidinic site) lyase n=1 Tax=Massilia sp. W12 TaxID=3126507 RepID=UPI0030D5E994
MPELPEVEVTRRGIAPYLEQETVSGLVLRREGLRWPFAPDLAQQLMGRKIEACERRGKYLILQFAHGVLILHLGMSGHLRILPPGIAPEKHDHVDLQMGQGAAARVLRFTDPRRFGAVLWHAHADGPWQAHPLLAHLGVEPLQEGFDGAVLHQGCRKRSAAIKQVLLAGDIVVGVGNIYCSEALFMARIHPKTPANRLSRARCDKLAGAIRQILAAAIEKGGSTLRDFLQVNGQSGYFQQDYFVYARSGQPCRVCQHPVRQLQQGQRSTFYCAHCQHW